MRRLGYQVVDALVDRISNLDQDAAWRGAPRQELEPRLLEPPPEDGHDFSELLTRLQRDVLQYAARVDHPRFMAFVPGCPTWPAILGDFIAAGHNIFQGTWLGSSGPSALELVVLDWFRQWVGFPEQAAGLLLSGGSAANLTALATARVSRGIAPAQRVALYVAADSHSSVIKATRVLGFHADAVRLIAADAHGRMSLQALQAEIARDIADGITPLAVVANAGTTSTGAIDDLEQIADLSARHNIWLHVDGAYGGFAMLTERGRTLLRGIERADSITLDPHKWLYQPFEVGCLLVRDGRTLDTTFHTRANYLQDTAVAGGDVNFGERGIQLTRSARAIKIWLSIQYFGLAAFRDAIDLSLDLTVYAAERIQQSQAFELMTPASLGIVCFRRVVSNRTPQQLDQLNARMVQQLGASGLALISSTSVHDKYALRFCILNHRTTHADVDRVLDWLENFSVD